MPSRWSFTRRPQPTRNSMKMPRQPLASPQTTSASLLDWRPRATSWQISTRLSPNPELISRRCEFLVERSQALSSPHPACRVRGEGSIASGAGISPGSCHFNTIKETLRRLPEPQFWSTSGHLHRLLRPFAWRRPIFCRDDPLLPKPLPLPRYGHPRRLGGKIDQVEWDAKFTSWVDLDDLPDS